MIRIGSSVIRYDSSEAMRLLNTTCCSSPKREDWPHEKCLLSVDDSEGVAAVATDDDDDAAAVEGVVVAVVGDGVAVVVEAVFR